jgi:Cof subfamily protein (haloacid dehalogenase superfamily)
MEIQTHASTRDIKAIVLDIDGTLLKSDHSLSDKNRSTLRAAIDAGIQVILATGKTRHSAESIIAALNLQSPGVYVQGLIVTNPDGTIRYQQTLDPNVARRVITFAEQRGFDVIAYSGNRLLTKTVDDGAHEITKFGEPQPEEVGPLVNMLGLSPVHKLLIGGKPKKLKALRWQLDKQVGEEATLMTTNLDNTLEVLPYGASKGKSMLALLREMNIAPENVLAVGDGENDVDMLKFVGIGVAVGNAHKLTKDVADFVVASNDDDGVAEAVERFVLAKLKREEDAKADADANTTDEKDTSSDNSSKNGNGKADETASTIDQKDTDSNASKSDADSTQDDA